MDTIVLATRNKGKVEEIRSIVQGVPVIFESVLDYPDIPEVIEDGKTLEENAIKKAKVIFEYTGLPSLSDDTGLEVFALDMRPGVFSARFAGENVTYDDNNRKLLLELNGVDMTRRTARFRCVAAFVGKGTEKITTGVCRGKIGLAVKGNGGFGYDPLFIPDGYDKTFAELSVDEKNRISHRARAFEEMRKFLLSFYR
jgi:XTP/dITP diphosphohydrolase